jgi:hypothetical protein
VPERPAPKVVESSALATNGGKSDDAAEATIEGVSDDASEDTSTADASSDDAA